MLHRRRGWPAAALLAIAEVRSAGTVGSPVNGVMEPVRPGVTDMGFLGGLSFALGVFAAIWIVRELAPSF